MSYHTSMYRWGFNRHARYLAAWQILTPRDIIPWVQDQMKIPPVKFLRLTHLTHLIILIYHSDFVKEVDENLEARSITC